MDLLEQLKGSLPEARVTPPAPLKPRYDVVQHGTLDVVEPVLADTSKLLS